MENACVRLGWSTYRHGICIVFREIPTCSSNSSFRGSNIGAHVNPQFSDSKPHNVIHHTRVLLVGQDKPQDVL